MKLFYRKDYQRVKKELENFKEIIKEKDNIIKENHNLNEVLENKIQNQFDRIGILNSTLKKSYCSNGGLKKEINKRKNEILIKEKEILGNLEIINSKDKEILELKAEIEDLKSNRYLIKTLKPGKTPNLNKTKISAPMSSNVRRFMKENFY